MAEKKEREKLNQGLSQESNLEQKIEIGNAETNPFQEMEESAADNITEISKDTKSYIADSLAKETEEKQQEFALQYFKDNESKIRQEGNLSDDQIINLVLSSKEKGGLGALAEINKKPEDIKNPEYKRIREELDEIGILRVDMKKSKIPEQTLFLWLDHSQETVRRERREIEGLKNSKRKYLVLLA